MQAQILNLLADLQDERALSYLFIAHDMAVVRHVSGRIAVMYLGAFVEEGPATAISSNPQHPYTRALLSAIPHVRAAGGRTRIALTGDLQPQTTHLRGACSTRGVPR